MGATEDAASRRPAPHRDIGVHRVRSSCSVMTLRTAGETVARRHAGLVVGAIVLLSTAFRFGVALAFDVPWIAPDEMIYGLVGESLWEAGQLSVRDLATPYYSLLTP